MNKNTSMIYKAIAVLIIIIGLVAMITAWDLLLFAGQTTTTVLVMEMGGVILCLAGYFLWHRSKREGKDREQE
ncbi:MAG: hypothetical protein QUS09_04875 [Methanotrichaceae archaeon]|nr:hypothetical protein [Methanotrichaceae archaeon]